MAAVILDPDRFAFSRAHYHIEVAQVDLRVTPVGFLRSAALDSTYQVKQFFIVQEVLFVEVTLVDRAVHQGYRRGIRYAVVSGFPVAGTPLLRIVRHNVQRGLRRADMNLRNIADVANERPRFQDRRHHRLREIAERKLFEVTLHDPEWLAIAAERRKFKRLPGSLS